MAQPFAKVEVVGPIGNPGSGAKWFGIIENGVLGQARFIDTPSAWIAWREYSLRSGGGDGGGLLISKKLRG